MEILEKLNEKYVDELIGFIPIHRIVTTLIALPPFLILLDGHEIGVVFSYALLTPANIFSLENGMLWVQPLSFWLLLFWVLVGGVLSCKLIRKIVVLVAMKSKFKAAYLEEIRSSAMKIQAALGDTKALEDAIEKKYQTNRKSTLTQTKLSEVLLSTFFLFACFLNSWQLEDAYCAVLLLSAGTLIEISAYRDYIRSVAPSYLLLGHLRKSLYQLEDGYYP